MATTEQRSSRRIAVAPAEVRANTFVRSFSRCLSDGGFEVVEYDYALVLPPRTRVVMLHWPNQFFRAQPPESVAAARHLLAAWRSARESAGVRFVWVAHNVLPHDVEPCATGLGQEFIAALDGIIYLSGESRAEIRAVHRPTIRHELVTRHGHYRDHFVTPAAPWPRPGTGIRLGSFGRIRPYKGLESLLACSAAAGIPDLQLAITGFRFDAAYAAAIESLAAGRPDVQLRFHSALLPESELEANIDACHGIVLPYRSILNSGAALMALSRNRPVLAPHRGSLGGIRDAVGEQWLHLYDGELRPEHLRSFVDHLRLHEGGTCDLAAYDWGPIGEELCGFIDGIG